MDKTWTTTRFGGGIFYRLRNILLLALLALWLPASGADMPRITLRLEGVTLSEALRRVSNAAGYEFFYNSGQLHDIDKRIDASYTNTPLQEVLDEIFADTPFAARIQERTIVVYSRPASSTQGASAQEERITLAGTVYDAANRQPMVGVTVVVEGSTVGTATDASGQWSLTLPPGVYNVLFSFVGYEPHVRHYNGRNASEFREVKLMQSTVEVGDVVVTGVYQRKKESSTGSATTFKSKELMAVGTQSVLQSLATLDPSFKITESVQFGSDPNRMPDFEIRGKSSVVGLKEEYGTDPNQPLFILDGFETTLETVMNLNMNRVASVTLLKDAASTAIYGSKASNGVVVIETKMPERGRLQLSYKGDFCVTTADLTDYNLMNASEKLQFETLAGVYTDTSDMSNQLRLDNLRNERLKGIAQGIDTYWLSEPLRTVFTHKHTLYAEGGE